MWGDLMEFMEKDYVPDFAIRQGIRLLLKKRLEDLCTREDGSEKSLFVALERKETFISSLQNVGKNGKNHDGNNEDDDDGGRKEVIAIETKAANEQHYEVPTEFFLYMMGGNMKYSCCLYPNGKNANSSDFTLKDAEEAMLDVTVKRAKIEDGMNLLELGCGWGSLTLFMAKRFPNAKITAVSNSATQREFIMAQAEKRGITNVNIVTCDVNVFSPPSSILFDRIVSVEMFEHMRNYKELLRRISTWLKDDGYLFVHIFVHKLFSYPFEVKDDTDWITKYFFLGGTMCSDDLLLYFQQHLTIEDRWRVNGENYSKTCEAWLLNIDRNKEEILEIFKKCYGAGEELKWLVRWRVFCLACSELFNYDNGSEWFVSHYLFKKNLHNNNNNNNNNN